MIWIGKDMSKFRCLLEFLMYCKIVMCYIKIESRYEYKDIEFFCSFGDWI